MIENEAATMRLTAPGKMTCTGDTGGSLQRLIASTDTGGSLQRLIASTGEGGHEIPTSRSDTLHRMVPLPENAKATSKLGFLVGGGFLRYDQHRRSSTGVLGWTSFFYESVDPTYESPYTVHWHRESWFLSSLNLLVGWVQ
jgi:hypothetical protein